MLGDLLYEKGLAYLKLIREEEARNAIVKAMLIFEHIKINSLEIDFSLDMHFKMETIRQLLGDEFSDTESGAGSN